MELHWRDPADPTVADRWLKKEKDVEVVTLVHCDTPSAVYNQLGEIVTASHGALLIVNAVSSIGAHEILFDQWRVGVLIGGSQKTLNTPPGLTILAVSKAALDRAKEVGGETFYINYIVWEDCLGKGGFPYTISDVLLYALKESLNKLLEEDVSSVFQRHNAARLAARRAAEALGLEPRCLERNYPTDTALKSPVLPAQLRRHIWEKYGVLVAGSWGPWGAYADR